jgi:hypothetical protein
MYRQEQCDCKQSFNLQKAVAHQDSEVLAIRLVFDQQLFPRAIDTKNRRLVKKERGEVAIVLLGYEEECDREDGERPRPLDISNRKRVLQETHNILARIAHRTVVC